MTPVVVSPELRFCKIGWDIDANGCWNWSGFRNDKGYGKFVHPGGQLAHRFSYSFCDGKIFDKMEIMHLCHNRSCVNPDHLQQGTHVENMRQAAEMMVFPQAKLTRSSVLEIFDQVGVHSDSVIAKKYGVTRRTIVAMRLGRNYKWLKEEKEK